MQFRRHRAKWIESALNAKYMFRGAKTYFHRYSDFIFMLISDQNTWSMKQGYWASPKVNKILASPMRE